MSTASCVFCDIVAQRAPAQVVQRWPEALAIVPLNPVTEGHVLVIPKAHVGDALASPLVTGFIMARAAEFANGPCNIITSVGEDATQSIFHLHVHVVPRRRGDGLALPWTKRPDDVVARWHSGSDRRPFDEFMAAELGWTEDEVKHWVETAEEPKR